MEELQEFFQKLFESNGFMPRWICGNWSDVHGWLYVVSNIAIWSAYFTIPIILFIILRKRDKIPFFNVIIWFSLFIFFCGVTHFLDAMVFWVPVYRLNAIILFCTAIVSWITVFILYRTIPKIMKYKSPERLNEIIHEQTEELKHAYHDLKESEVSFKALVNKNPDSIIKIGKDFRYKFVNESMERMSSIGLAEYIGKTPNEVFPYHPYTKEFMEKLKLVIDKKREIYFEMTTLEPSQGLKTHSIEMIPLLDEEDEIENILAITKDISDIKENELRLNKIIFDLNHLTKRLEYKRKTLQDFAYIVSHNLRSPVSNLTSLVNLYESSENIEFKNDIIKKFIQVSENLSVTVEDLTEVVSINQNEEIEKENLSFSEILDKQQPDQFIGGIDTSRK